MYNIMLAIQMFTTCIITNGLVLLQVLTRLLAEAAELAMAFGSRHSPRGRRERGLHADSRF